MASEKTSPPKWLSQPPSAFDIVTAFFPETKPKGELRPRPCLVLDVLKGKVTGAISCRITYGTKNLKFVQRQYVDLIIQNNAHLNAMGLPMATRFDLDERNIVTLPWTDEYFACWTGYEHPRLCSLPEEYVKSYFYIRALRDANKKK